MRLFLKQKGRTMKLTALLLVLGFTGTAMASDHWDDCSSADGRVSLSMEALTVDDKNVPTAYELKVLSTVQKEETKCVLKETGEEALLYANEITVEEIAFTDDVGGAAYPRKEVLICQRGFGSFIPQEACKE